MGDTLSDKINYGIVVMKLAWLPSLFLWNPLFFKVELQPDLRRVQQLQHINFYEPLLRHHRSKCERQMHQHFTLKTVMFIQTLQ
jgi:hypothetical protein